MNRHAEVVSSFALLSVLLGATGFLTGCCQPGYPCQNTGPISLGPSKGEVIGLGVGVLAVSALAVGTAVEVNHAKHNLKGCVTSGPNGPQLANDSDKKTYSLVGKSADLKAGEKVKLNGDKQKKHKGNPGNQEFLVKKVTKDLGPCQLAATPATDSTTGTH